MALLRTNLIQELREAREELLNINFDDDTPPKSYAYAGGKRIELFIPPTTPWKKIRSWLDKWTQTFRKVNTISRGAVKLHLLIPRQVDGFEKETDPEIFNELRPALVELIDRGLSILDQEYEVKSLLEDYIKRVKDTKLTELLKEFNASKDTSPNLAAIGFRTILSLVIQEKAKREKPQSDTATKTDLALDKMISSAKTDGIL